VLTARSLFEVRVLARPASRFDTVYVVELPIPNLLGYFDGIDKVFRYAPPTTGEWFRFGHLVAHYERNAGLPEGSVKPRIWIRPEDARTVDPLWRKILGRKRSGPVIAVHTHSSVDTKNWPEDRFSELLTRWGTSREAHFVVVGGPGEGDSLRGLSNVTVTAGSLTPKQTAEIVRRCDFFVGLDSGLAYVAEAVETPGLIIMGATVRETCGPRGADYRFIRPCDACLPACHRTCTRTPFCIASLTVDEVDRALSELLTIGAGVRSRLEAPHSR
jgi:ADP-heptose:LPS heptosyltransferase